VATDDKILIKDTSASDVFKYVTAQSIADLAPSTPGGSDTQLQYNNSGSFGGVSSLTYNGSNVTSTKGVTVDGTADEIQLKVQAHSSQTSNIFEIETSAAANLVTVNNAGLMTISGALTVDNLSIDGNTISSSSGAVVISPTNGQALDVNLTGGAGVTYDFTGAGDFSIDMGSGDVVITSGNIDLTGNIVVSGTVDGRDVSVDGAKLDGITGTNTGDQNLFSTIAVSGQSNVVADSTSDTLTLVAGTNITITTNAGTDTITISASGGGASDVTSSIFFLMGA
jgi:hypothetical protein